MGQESGRSSEEQGRKDRDEARAAENRARQARQGVLTDEPEKSEEEVDEKAPPKKRSSAKTK
jgi:hypothetical protein